MSWSTSMEAVKKEQADQAIRERRTKWPEWNES